MNEQLGMDGLGVPMEPPGPKVRNPLIPIFGPDPEGRRCGACAHLFVQPGVSGRYLKCDLRRNTSGPSTDHRARWDACARFEPQEE